MTDLSERTHRVQGPRESSGRIRYEGVEVPKEQIDKLEAALESALEGEVRFSIGDRALYATDASNYRQIPYGVVLPRTSEDVVAAVRLCNAHDVPITPRGGGTSLAGQTCNTSIIIDFSKYMHRILSIDVERWLAIVEPGCILDHLRSEANTHGLTFSPDPATHDHNTLGGMIGNDSCGVHSVMAGRTADNVQSLDILTYDGLRMTVGPTGPAELSNVLASGGKRAELYRTSAFRDELPALFPDDPQAKALSKQTRFLSEFLKDRRLSPVSLDQRSPVLAQFHCHHHAVLDKKAEKELIEALPVKAEILDQGCCGMAGAFGFEADKYELSRTIAERGILPKIKAASEETVLLANGFSCREQIEQLTGRRTLHLAEYLAPAAPR